MVVRVDVMVIIVVAELSFGFATTLLHRGPRLGIRQLRPRNDPEYDGWDHVRSRNASGKTLRYDIAIHGPCCGPRVLT